jgi:hypothetical protein
MDRTMPDKATIEHLYWDENLSLKEIALKFNICPMSVKNRLSKTRTKEEGLRLVVRKGTIRSPSGRRRTSNGYVAVYKPNHPRAFKSRGWKGYVYEHTAIWEAANNRLLPKGWCVHHVNGIKDDNRPENLIAFPREKHDKLIPYLLNRIKQLELALENVIKPGVN